MANELRHSDVGTALSKAEWEAVGSHILNSQAAGDIIYASSTSQLSRLGIGSAKQMLAVNSGGTAPEWVSSPPVVTALVPDAADGATIGTAALEFSDIYLADSAVVYFGNDQEVTLTHVADAGLLLNAAMYLTFRDAALKIYSSTDGQLDIDADTEVEITATTVDLNGNLDVSGTLTQTGIATFAARPVFNASVTVQDGGNIGSASDLDAIAISAGGVVTMNQIPVFSAGINVSGGTIAGTLATAAQGNVTSLGTLTALTVDDVAINGKVITMTGDTSDTTVITAGTNGTLSIVTTDAAAAAANIQITADGTVDIDSAGVLTLDSGAAINIEPASGSAILLDGTISIDAGVVTGATSITSTAFVGTIDGVVGGNTPAAITGTTIDANTDFTIGDTVITDGVVTDSTGLALAANVTVTGNVLPNADDTYDLGSALAAWQDLFLEGDITLSDAGTIATSAGALTLTSAAAATWSTAAGVLTIDGDDGIVLNTGGSGNVIVSEAMSVGATTAPDGTLHVHAGSAGSVTANSLADDLVVENSATGGISILVPDDANAMVNFGSASDNYGAQIYWDYDGSKLVVGTANAGDKIIFQTADGTESAHLSGGATPTFQFQGATTLSTSTGALTIDGDDGIVLQTTGSGSIELKEDVAVTGSMTITETATTGPTITLTNVDTTMPNGQQAGTISFVGSDLNAAGEHARIGATADGTSGQAALSLYTGTVGSVSERMRIDADGTTAFYSTVTVGVDDTGYDVKFFGDTASAYTMWDTSVDDLVFAGVAGIASVDSQLPVKINGQLQLDANMANLYIKGGGVNTGPAGIVWGFGETVTLVTTLAEALDASETGIDVTSASGLTTSDFIRIDDEIMDITGISTNTLTVTRGYEGTVAAEHDNGTNVYNIPVRYASMALDFDTRASAGEGLKIRSANGYMMTLDAGNDLAFQTDGVSRMTITNGGTVNFGVNDDGEDVKFFGATAGTFMLWDESDDRLELESTSTNPAVYIRRNENTSVGATDFSLLAYHNELGSSKFSGSYNIDTSANNTGHGRLRLRIGNDDTGNFNAMILEDNGSITVGGAIAHDAGFIFDGNATDWYAALDDSDDAFVIGEGSTVGTTVRYRMQKSGQHYFSNSIGGAYTQGSGTVVVGTVFEHVLTGIAGMESYAAHVLIGSNGDGQITTQNQGETIPIIASLYLNDPDISNGGGNPDTITATAALYVAGIASEGTDDYAIFVDAGNTRLDGALMVGNPTGGMKGTGTVNAQALYDDNSFLSDWVFEEYYEKGMELTRN